MIELLLGLGLIALIAFWVVRLSGGSGIPVPPAASAGNGDGASRVDQVLMSARLFGSRPPGALSDNVRALGVVADGSGHGSVIVSVDGQAPRVYRIGDTLDGRLVTAIRPDEIELENGGARQTFRLPAARPVSPGLTIIGSGPVVAGAAPPAASPYGPAQPMAGTPPPMVVTPEMTAPPGAPMSAMPQQASPAPVPGAIYPPPPAPR